MSGEDGTGITLSNADLAFMKLGKSSTAQKKTFLDTRSPEIRVLAGGQIDGPQAGIAKQGGDTYFLQRFALQPHSGYDASHAMRVAMEHQNPPVASRLTGDSGKLPAESYSLVTNSNPEVLLWALKPAEDGASNAIVARTWNVGTKPQSFRLTLGAGLRAAQQATHIETPLRPMKVGGKGVTLKAEPTEVQTIILQR
jgi:alpha-mannosidase